MLMGFFGGTPLPEDPQVLPTTLIVRSSTAPKARIPPVTSEQMRPRGHASSDASGQLKH